MGAAPLVRGARPRVDLAALERGHVLGRTRIAAHELELEASEILQHGGYLVALRGAAAAADVRADLLHLLRGLGRRILAADHDRIDARDRTDVRHLGEIPLTD